MSFLVLGKDRLRGWPLPGLIQFLLHVQLGCIQRMWCCDTHPASSSNEILVH